MTAINPLAPVDLSYQWRRNGLDLPGATNATLVVTSLASRHAGEYTVEVSNFAGRATSAPSAFGVSEPLRLLTTLTDLSAVAGQTVTFSVVAAGTGPLSYQWRHNGIDVRDATGSVLILRNVREDQAGRYQVSIRDAAGSLAGQEASLVVHTLPLILRQPESQNVLGGDRREWPPMPSARIRGPGFMDADHHGHDQ